jgi:hypothetical protein
MRGPPHTPQTHFSEAPAPFGSTRAMALQCGHRFDSPLVFPQRLHTPPETATAPHALQVARESFTAQP